MGRRTSVNDALAERAWALLGDGAWHNYEATLRELGALVPPGVAMRQFERDRLARRNRRNVDWRPPPKRKQNLDVSRQILSGQRSVVRAFVKNPAFEKDRPGSWRGPVKERQIRMLRPMFYGGRKDVQKKKSKVEAGHPGKDSG